MSDTEHPAVDSNRDEEATADGAPAEDVEALAAENRELRERVEALEATLADVAAGFEGGAGDDRQAEAGIDGPEADGTPPLLPSGGLAHKVVGEIDADGSVGIKGYSKGSSGTNYGVWGEVDADEGYGLYTPDDARIDGVATSDGDWIVEVEDGDDAANVVAGHSVNGTDGDVVGATIGGGGGILELGDGTTVEEPNQANDDYATIGGGKSNSAGNFGTVGGGTGNAATGFRATIAGGGHHQTSGNNPTVGGGYSNDAKGNGATAGGGHLNDATADFATVAGGGPADTSDESTNNVVHDNYGTIGGGGDNQAGSDDDDETIAEFSTVGGGESNTANGHHATVAGGESNHAGTDTPSSTAGEYTTVGGGKGNAALGEYTTVGGGENNTADYSRATVGGGQGNEASGWYATVSGGSDNTATGRYASVPGGSSNVADGWYSTAMGREADTNGYDGAVVIGDSSSSSIQAQNSDELRSQVPIYAPSTNTTSARAAKTAIEPVDPERVLEDVESLDVSTWEFTDTDDGRHMGPMAGEFRETFELGEDDGTISSVDADGVAFAAIQGLAARLDEENERRRKEVEHLRDELAETESRLARIEERMSDTDDAGAVTADD